MQLEPPFLIVESKLTHYLLVYRDKDDKSNYLRLAGYELGNWRSLEQDLLILARSDKAVYVGTDGYGPAFITGKLEGPNSHTLRVKTIWKRDIDEEITKFITLYPPKQ